MKPVMDQAGRPPQSAVVYIADMLSQLAVMAHDEGVDDLARRLQVLADDAAALAALAPAPASGPDGR